MNKRIFLLLSVAVVVLAFAVREWYLLASTVKFAVMGDGVDYMRYAYNLVHHGMFSRVGPTEVPYPDAYRGPGYPLLLAVSMSVWREAGPWVHAVQQAQALLGAGTVALVIALGRQWMGRGAALVAGLLIAFWPHHVVATQAVLSEVLFGFVIVLSLLLSWIALKRQSIGWGAWAGAAFAYGYLVNPLIALLPILLLAVFWRAKLPKVGAMMIWVVLLVVGLWTMRPSEPSESRAIVNAVQGSLPNYHLAWHYKGTIPGAAKEYKEIDHEVGIALEDPNKGFARAIARMEAEPARYLRWYAYQKAYALWDWNVMIGAGGIYVIETYDSPFEHALAPVKELYRIANLPLFLLALIAAFMSLFRSDASRFAGIAFLYLTLVHVVFQAEPRYAIAYRPVEVMLSVALLSWLLQAYKRRSKGHVFHHAPSRHDGGADIARNLRPLQAQGSGRGRRDDDFK